MSYFNKGKGKVAPVAHDIPGASSLKGIGFLPKGNHTATVDAIKNDNICFVCFPEGAHVEKIPDVQFVKGETVRLIVGLTRGASLRRNDKGEYAMVDAHDKSVALTSWNSDINVVVAEGLKLPLAGPSIREIYRGDALIYLNDGVKI